jgi:leader peptidase (prepilin peptidase)/N-methyltransferase
MIELLQQSPPVAIAAASLVGAAVGSFLNVVIHRVPEDAGARNGRRRPPNSRATADADAAAPASPDGAKYNLMVPRSALPSCGHEITALENIPVLVARAARPLLARAPRRSRPATRRRAATAGAERPPRSGSSAPTAGGLGALVLTWFLVALTFIDVDTQLLPDDMTLPLLWLGLLLPTSPACSRRCTPR